MLRTLVVPGDMTDARLDQALAALVEGLSRRAARGLIQKGSVYVDGRRCRIASRIVAPGSGIRVEAEPVRTGAEAPPSRLAILWRDRDVVAVDKPAGMASAPTRSGVEGCAVHVLSMQLGVHMQSLHPVHRLDRGTSGVLLIGLTAEGARRLGLAFQEGRVRKTYNAWVHTGPPAEAGTWDVPLSRPVDGAVRADELGRAARTDYRVIRREVGASLLELFPRTGRTHQLRVHCALAGCPIAGDVKYGAPSGAARLMLHARCIRFPLPDGSEQEVEAPLPPDMVTWKGPRVKD